MVAYARPWHACTPPAVRPREVILLQRLYFIYFVQGASDQLRDLPAAVLRHYDDDAYVLGMRFGLEETHDFARAFETGQQALARNREDVWALHALAHAFYETGGFIAGTRLLEEGLQHCDNVGTFRTHILWHLALFLWEQASISRHSRCIMSSSLIRHAPPPNFVDSVSLLWRLNLTGQPTAGVAGPHPLPGGAPAHAHLLVQPDACGAGLTGARRLDWATAYLDGLRARVKPEQPGLLGEVGVPLVEGLIAYANGAYARTVACLQPIQARIIDIGGSHAQREIFSDILLDAALQNRSL